MGCSSSKLEDLPAVALCRDRCAFLDDAIHQRHALTQAHLSYLHSLKGVGLSLLRFFDHDLLLNINNSTTSPLPSPVIPPPPPQTKQHNHNNNVASAPIHHHHHSHSNSGSHLHFQDSDSDDSLPDSPLHHHSGNNSPFLQNNNNNNNSSSYYDGQFSYPAEDHDALGSYPVGDFMSTNMNLNYMKNKATPSVSYEQRPVIPQTVYMGESSSSSSYFPPPPNETPPSSYSTTNYNGGGPGINGFFGSPPSYGPSYGQPAPVAAAEASASASKKPPPPPPSPPRNTGWDFLNPFESFDTDYPVHTSSRGFNELREEEGIPDLEDDDFQQEEVVKEVQVERKFIDSRKGMADGSDSDSLYRIRPDISIGNDPGEYDVHMVDKKVVDDEERRSGGRGNVAAFKVHNDSEVVREIQVQFERASESGDEVAKMLDVGKFVHKKNSAYQG